MFSPIGVFASFGGKQFHSNFFVFSVLLHFAMQETYLERSQVAKSYRVPACRALLVMIACRVAAQAADAACLKSVWSCVSL